METQLYPGIAFSPVAALTDNIGAGDTIIPVSDAESFPPAPNLATIGADEEGETVLYAAKTATALSGCTRGVEGTARAWSAGEPIARNWTAKDHADLIAAVREAKEASDPAGTAAAALEDHQEDTAAHVALFAAKQNKLTGQPGQVVGFDGMGLAYAVPGWSNPNLLINADFRKPVNRRGQAEYASYGYTVDRWYLPNDSMKVSVTNQGLHLEIVKGTPWWIIAQNVESEIFHSIIGRTVTLSILTNRGLHFHTCTIPDGAFDFDFDVIPGTLFKINLYYSGSDHLMFRIYTMNSIEIGNTLDVIAVKLELGPIQTLARQDADGNWVLNDPPDYDLQYALCSLYSPITGEWVGFQHSNPNLLDNWYFVDPINQKGQTQYEAKNTGKCYSIDRWFIGHSILTILDNGIKIELNIDVLVNCFVQKISMKELSLRGKMLTFSALAGDCPDGFAITLQSYNKNNDFISEEIAKIPSGNSLLTTTYTIPDDADYILAVFRIGQSLTMPKGSYITLTAAKLELGPVQTLAHQDADGKWVLNDPQPNKALELAKCQRYQIVFQGPYAPIGTVIGRTDSGGFASIQTPVQMRATPTITGTVTINSIGDGIQLRGAIFYTPNQIGIALEDKHPFSPNECYEVFVSPNCPNSTVIIDANL